jgi:TolB-like protein/Flp pilus assembly protein TadD
VSDVSSRARGREAMTRARWVRLEKHVDALLDLTAADRKTYCAVVEARDPALGSELSRLAEHCEGRDALLDAGALERFSVLFDEADRELRDQVQSSLGDAYALQRELEGGGMSLVFVARERDLGREVVIKVLSPEQAATIRVERFAREIKLAASLQQANIVPVLSAGTAAGLPYYTMPFVEGRSLRERLEREGALPVGDGVSILRDVARALAYAHAHGVVHRDIKPGNVLLSGGTAVVTDFGIAKALGAAREAAGGATLTSEGVSLGTPAYMAPEQASGDPGCDHRADLYAFGCLAYEVFTGRPPFTDSSVHKIIAAHFTETPVPVAERRAELPEPLAALIGQCLEKDVERRPRSATEVLERLDASMTVPRVAKRSSVRGGMLVGATLAVAALATAAYVANRATAEPLTLSLVPFQNLARDSALEYRSDGVGDEILNGIARVPGIRIVGRNTALRYKERSGVVTPDVRTMERELGARFLVTGSIRRAGDRITLSAQLNDSAVHGEVWAATFARDAKDFASITDDIVRSIADTLHARFPRTVARQGAGAAPLTKNAEALDLYLLGQTLLKRRGSGVEQSVDAFERAIALDTNFARAYASLATALQLYPYFNGRAPSELSAQTANAAHRALELDSTIAEAHMALGMAYAAAGEWQAVNAELRHAIALDPDNVPVRQTYARILIMQNRASEALEHLSQARKIERMSPTILPWVSYAFLMLGSRDSALAALDRAVQLDSTLLPVTNLGALVYLAAGKRDEARRLMTPPAPPSVMTDAPYVFARLGDTVAANRLLRQIDATTPRPWFARVAGAMVRLATGDSAAALDALERSARESGPMWAQYIPLSDPAFDLVRGSPRFVALLRQAHLEGTAVANR